MPRPYKAKTTAMHAPGEASTRLGGNASTNRIRLAKQAATQRKDTDEFARLTAVVKEHQQRLDSAVSVQPGGQPPAPSSVNIPIRVHVNMMGGTTVEVHAEPHELVAYLRRRVAKAAGKPLTQLVLTLGTSVLHGMQVVGEVFGELECVHISAFLSDECGPVEEWMDADHPEGLTEYMPDLYSKLKIAEKKPKVCISSTYMARQSDINIRMRAILLDRLVEVHSKYRLRTVSLFLTVQVLDRYLQERQIHRKRLQLAGLAAMSIAAKFEEGIPLEMETLLHMCDGQFTRADFARMEVDMLNAIGFDLCTPTAGHFLDLYKQANRCDDHHGFAVQYLMELAFSDMELAGELASKSAAAATFLSNQLLHRDVYWPQAMASYTGYSAETLQPVSQKMRELLVNAATADLGALYRKFSSAQYGHVARRLV